MFDSVFFICQHEEEGEQMIARNFMKTGSRRSASSTSLATRVTGQDLQASGIWTAVHGFRDLYLPVRAVMGSILGGK
jgi:hypothetical protein